MSEEPAYSYIKGDFSILEKQDNTGGNLSVDGDISFSGELIGNLPVASEQSSGAVKVGAGLGIDNGSLAWSPEYKYTDGQTSYTGGGAYICVDSASLAIDTSGNEPFLKAKFKSGGGLILDPLGYGLALDIDSTKTLLGLGAAAYKGIAANTGNDADANLIPQLGAEGVLDYAVIPGDYIRESGLNATLEGYSVLAHQHTVQPVYAVPVSGIITIEPNKTQYVKTITGSTVIGFDTTGLNLGESDTATFELLLKMESVVYPVLFGSSITWLNEDEPYFNVANKSYLLAFRTYDGGQSWVGSYQGQF